MAALTKAFSFSFVDGAPAKCPQMPGIGRNSVERSDRNSIALSGTNQHHGFGETYQEAQLYGSGTHLAFIANESRAAAWRPDVKLRQATTSHFHDVEQRFLACLVVVQRNHSVLEIAL